MDFPDILHKISLKPFLVPLILLGRLYVEGYVLVQWEKKLRKNN